jgi:hypothetical protein
MSHRKIHKPKVYQALEEILILVHVTAESDKICVNCTIIQYQSCVASHIQQKQFICALFVFRGQFLYADIC